MSSLELYLTHPLAEAVGWALLHSLWQGALVALLFAGSLGLARRRSPQLRYLLGCGALALLVALPLGTGALLYESVRPVPPIQSGVAAGALPTTAPTENVAAPTERTSPSASPLASQAPVISWGARALALLETAAPWLTGVWLLGVVLFLLRLSGQALYVHRFRARHRTPADPHWQARARTLAARLGVRRPWQLVQSSRADTPLTFGVLRPLIVLPASALTGMPAAQLEALLAHELEHVRRHDYLVNLFQCVVEALLFYHPAVWWVSSTVRRAREECCDDASVAVCGDARLYARALTNLEALRQPPALALAATDAPLLARVKRLLGLGEARPFPPTATAVLLVFMLVLGTGLGVVGQTTAQEAPTASPPAPEAPKQGSLLEGIVVWNDERVANIKVELREEPEDDEIERWDTTPALQTTRTNSKGEYSFEDVPPGNYVVWALGNEEIYQIAGYPATVYVDHGETSGIDTIRLDKVIKVIGPMATTVTTLKPTLRWKPVPGAVRYEVGIDDLASPEDPLAIRRYYRTDTPNLELTEPLQRDRFYSWSVTAYTENGTQIASAYEPMFSTGRPKTLRPVNVRGIGVSTVLPTDWQQTSPGVFEYVDAEGEKISLTFEKRPRADLELEALAELRRFSQRYADREWGYFTENGRDKLVTVESETAYLITVDGLTLTNEEPTFPTMELFAVVIPTMLRNFRLDEQPSSTAETDVYGFFTPPTLQDRIDQP